MNTAKDYVHGHSAIVFDLDGTLLHTEPDIRKATNQALLDCGFQTLAPEQVRSIRPLLIEASSVIEFASLPGSPERLLIEVRHVCFAAIFDSLLSA